MLNLYVTSSEKKQGKTFIVAGLALTMQSLGYKTVVYKPIQTSGIEINGFAQSPDLTYIKSLDPYIETGFTYVFKNDSTPYIAAESDNTTIDSDLIFGDLQKLSAVNECTIIDGDGGIFTPISPSFQNADLVKKLQVPLLYIINPNENAINDILLNLYVAENKGLNVAGVVINNVSEDSSNKNLTELIRITEEYTNYKILGLVPKLASNSKPEDIITSILNGVDIESIFNIKIAKLDL